MNSIHAVPNLSMQNTSGRLRFPIKLKLWNRCREYVHELSERLIANECARCLRQRHGPALSYRRLGHFDADRMQRWSETSALATATVVVVTYRQPAALRCLLSSLAAQTLRNFDIIVIHDGADSATGAVVADFANWSPIPVRYIETDIRYNDYGHSLRELGIAEAQGDFLILTNGDNYYAPRLMEYAFEAINRHELDIVLWDMVHSHANPGMSKVASYRPFSAFPLRYGIDIGNILVRSSYAKRVGFPDRSHDADASYFEALLDLPLKRIAIGKIDKTLMVHN